MDTNCTMLLYSLTPQQYLAQQCHWITERPYLAIIASNEKKRNELSHKSSTIEQLSRGDSCYFFELLSCNFFFVAAGSLQLTN